MKKLSREAIEVDENIFLEKNQDRYKGGNEKMHLTARRGKKRGQ